MPTPMISDTGRRSLWILLALALAGLACNLPFQADDSAATGSMVEGYPSYFNSEPFSEYALSQTQRAVLAERGYPDRFILRFFREIQAADLEQEIRLETWFFDEDGLEVVFQNGEPARSRQTEPKVMVGLGQTAYRPEQFTAFISLDELVGVTGQADFYQRPLDDGLVPGGEILWMEGLTAGFKGGQLLYLETIPLGQAGLAGPEPSLVAPTPLAQAPLAATEGPTETSQPPPIATLPPVMADGGESIILAANPNGSFELISVDLAAGSSRNLTAHPADDRYASCSPNGDWIAFVSDRTGNDEVFLIDRDGDNLKQITSNGTKFKDAILWFSPTELVYWDGSGDSGWFITAVDGREPEMLPFKQGESLYPDHIVSPDGSASLEAVRMDPDQLGDWDIFIDDGAGERNLTNSPGTADMFPVWAPDSQKFVYQSDSDGDVELYIMDRQGTILEQLTNNDHTDQTGCWLP